MHSRFGLVQEPLQGCSGLVRIREALNSLNMCALLAALLEESAC